VPTNKVMLAAGHNKNVRLQIQLKLLDGSQEHCQRCKSDHMIYIDLTVKILHIEHTKQLGMDNHVTNSDVVCILG